MKKKLRERAIKLRVEKEMSYSQIKKELGVAKSTLSYWLRDYPISEEKIKELRKKGWQKGEAARERYRNTMREKKERRRKKIYKEELKKFKEISSESKYVAGIILYLGEGAKKKAGQINLANTDPKVIKFFRDWLNKFLDVPKKDIKYQLHLYENMDIAKEENFWKNVLGIKKGQLYKTQVRKLREDSFSYKHSKGHGTCSMYTFGVKKRDRLMASIKAFLDANMRV